MVDLSEYERRLLANVDEHGWQFTYVFDPDKKGPDFGYSVGFSKTLKAPEFIIFGLPKDMISSMSWSVYRQIKKGQAIEDGQRWSGLLEGFECVSRHTSHPDLYTEYAISAQWYWHYCGNEGEPEVYQMVWPGVKDGLFPWDGRCADAVIDAQPALWG
ncbi:MAG: DUF4262 domain-containing protein [Pseudomonadota bacterium]